MAGGTPTLSLNDGGTATYTGGAGPTNALTFSYIVNPTDSNVAALAVAKVNLPIGTTIRTCRQCSKSHRRGNDAHGPVADRYRRHRR